VFGGALSGITGTIIGMCVPDYEVKQYEGKLKEGKILISVHTEDPDEMKRAKGIFRRANAEDISSVGEAPVGSYEIDNERTGQSR
jgi:hypothetical protein